MTENYGELRSGLIVRYKEQYLLLHVTKRDGCTVNPADLCTGPHWSCSKGILSFSEKNNNSNIMLLTYVGGIEGEESPLDCALREFHEETGFDIINEPTLWEHQKHFSRMDPSKWNSFAFGYSYFTPKGDKVLLYCIVDDQGKIFDYTPKMRKSGEHDAFAWFTAEQATSVALSSQQHIFSDKMKLHQHFNWKRCN